MGIRPLKSSSEDKLPQTHTQAPPVIDPLPCAELGAKPFPCVFIVSQWKPAPRSGAGRCLSWNLNPSGWSLNVPVS